MLEEVAASAGGGRRWSKLGCIVVVVAGEELATAVAMAREAMGVGVAVNGAGVVVLEDKARVSAAGGVRNGDPR